MTKPRSTRNRLRFQAKKALADIDACEEHLRKLDYIADGRSDYITEMLPKVITMIEAVKGLLIDFRESL